MELNINRIGFYISILTVLITIITFIIAIFTPPLSGPFCQASCFVYPYNDIINRFPRDYIWIYTAIIQLIIFIVFVHIISYFASENKKIYNHIGVSFSLISATILLIDYFIQISVIPQSILKNELEGIAILTQYNPHGIFIALEELGYIIMSIAFIFLGVGVSKNTKIEKLIHLTFILGAIIGFIALIIVSLLYNISREYIFEIAIIFVNRIVLIITGTLYALLFKKSQNTHLKF